MLNSFDDRKEGLSYESEPLEEGEFLCSFGKKERLNSMNTFVIPDIHGCINALNEALFNFRLINVYGNWVAKEPVRIVVLGDVIDRGGHDKEVLERLISIKSIVESKGGEFICLMGNHELLLFNALFGSPRVPSVASHIITYRDLCRSLMEDFGIDSNGSLKDILIQTRSTFLKDENERFLEFFRSMVPFYQFGDVLAVHGMVTPFSSQYLLNEGIEYVNNTFWSDVLDNSIFGFFNHIYKGRGGSYEFNVSSPMWADFDALTSLDDQSKMQLVSNLNEMGVRMVVCGHQRYHDVRCIEIDGVRFVCLDTGISSGYSTYGNNRYGGMAISKGDSFDFEAVNSDGSICRTFDQMVQIR